MLTYFTFVSQITLIKSLERTANGYWYLTLSLVWKLVEKSRFPLICLLFYFFIVFSLLLSFINLLSLLLAVLFHVAMEIPSWSQKSHGLSREENRLTVKCALMTWCPIHQHAAWSDSTFIRFFSLQTNPTQCDLVRAHNVHDAYILGGNRKD